MTKYYGHYRPYELDCAINPLTHEAGGYYCRHVSALTEEDLHAKSDIAAELGWRDLQIDTLTAERDLLKEKLMVRDVWSERDRLRAELERERMRLAACGVVAMANTPESAARARDIHPDYRSASCDDVARAVDSEMSLRAELASWQEAFGLLTTLHGSIQIDSSDPMGMAKQIESHVRATIEAALAGGEK